MWGVGENGAIRAAHLRRSVGRPSFGLQVYVPRAPAMCAALPHDDPRHSDHTRKRGAGRVRDESVCADLELSDIHFAVQMMTRLMHCNDQRVDA